MKPTSLHILLIYKCNLQCDHCFIWSGPRKNGLMTLPNIKLILQQVRQLGTVRSIYFEGGEPFLYYTLLVEAVKEAVQQGFTVGLVTNAFWARSIDQALEKLRPLAGLVQDFSVSSDLYHWRDPLNSPVRNACQAAELLGIPLGKISIAQPETTEVVHPTGQRPTGESGVMYRGRAAVKLADRAPQHPWEGFNACPYEDLINPERMHIDPLGNLLICEGVSLGNVFQTSLEQICKQYDPQLHPVTGPLVAGGPAELARRYGLPHDAEYADACHLCYAIRQSLRSRFPDVLTPAQVYQEI